MRRKIQRLLIWRLIIAAVLLGTVALIERSSLERAFTPILTAAVAVVCLLSAAYYGMLFTQLSLDTQGYAQLCLDTLVVTWLVYATGDVESPFVPLYLVAVFAGSILFSRAGVFSLAFIGATSYALCGVLTITGAVSRGRGVINPFAASGDYYEASRLPSIEFMLALNLVAIFVVAILSSQLAERIRHSESQLAIATRDLADYRLFNDRIIESMRSGLVTTDLQGSIITFNRAAEEITGYKAQDVRGTNIYAIFGDIEKQIETGLESIRSRSRLPRFDIGCKTADGRDIHLGFSVSPLVEESGRTPGYVLTFQDLTEVIELEREVRRQERLAALGKMAAGLAHEIRNPLASMRGSVQVLAGELDLSPDQSQLMEIVLRASDCLNRTVSDFLIYARPPRMERSVVELNSLLSETISLLRNSSELRPDHRITELHSHKPIHYYGDPNQIRQIFWNLARNAIQAMPNGGEFRVSLDTNSAGELTITFSDTGQGMSRDQKERLFEPFSSSSGGTGLGMAIVYQLVNDHNGKIVVDSDAGKGTSISIKLPASGRPRVDAAASARAQEASPVA